MIRDRLWYEIADIKLGEVYLGFYLHRCRIVKKYFQGFTILFSTTGVFGWQFWEYYAAIACGIIAAIQLAAVLSDQIVRSDDDLAKIAKLRGYYTRYLMLLEGLWNDLETESLSESDVKRQFQDIRNSLGQKIQNMDNALLINGTLQKLYTKSEIQTTNYLNSRYGKTEHISAAA
jgi:hypothetical protein